MNVAQTIVRPSCSSSERRHMHNGLQTHRYHRCALKTGDHMIAHQRSYVQSMALQQGRSGPASYHRDSCTVQAWQWADLLKSGALYAASYCTGPSEASTMLRCKWLSVSSSYAGGRSENRRQTAGTPSYECHQYIFLGRFGAFLGCFFCSCCLASGPPAAGAGGCAAASSSGGGGDGGDPALSAGRACRERPTACRRLARTETCVATSCRVLIPRRGLQVMQQHAQNRTPLFPPGGAPTAGRQNGLRGQYLTSVVEEAAATQNSAQKQKDRTVGA